MRAAQQLRRALRVGGEREQEERREHYGRRKQPATTPDASDHGFLRVSAFGSAD